MKTQQQRRAELEALSQSDPRLLRSEFWTVVCGGGGCRYLARVSVEEMVNAILAREFPEQREAILPGRA